MNLNKFQNQDVSFVEKTFVKEGIVCDVYTFLEDDTKDLGIVTVSKGELTPKQKVLIGEKTEEIFLSGKGVLEVVRVSGIVETYNFPSDKTTV